MCCIDTVFCYRNYCYVVHKFVENILFASEVVGAVRGVDPETGFEYDDTKRYVDAAQIPAAHKQKIFEDNCYAVYPRLKAQLRKQGVTN